MFLLTELNKIWSTLQERVYKTKTRDVHELRKRIVDECDRLDQRVTDKVVGEWQKRLELECLQEENSLNIRCEHF